MRDPAIKLFGKEISLPENGRIPVVSGVGSAGDFLEYERVIGTGDEELGTDKDSQREHETLHDSEDDPKTPQIIEENENEKTPDTENENEKTSDTENEAIIEENGNEKTPDTENEANPSDRKPLKKPDKILPCPRCNSTDTKFCYYNNYNVNQPRHFCKGCHRYWTAGGTMRNVPVGAGRRKNKNSVQITISEAIAKKVISFGRETGMGQKGVFRNGVFGMENENGSECSSGTSVITTSSSKSNISINQVSCLQGYPWPYPAISNPGFCPQYPIPVYPIPYWPIPIPNTFLGKHSRNGDLIINNNHDNIEFEEPKSAERSILIPKTLRIDDPDEAAKSSIWATLGIKNDFVNRKGFFKAFEAKCDENKKNAQERSSLMRANPAAMSRSLNFLETA